MRPRRPVGVFYWILLSACALGIGMVLLESFAALTSLRIPKLVPAVLLCAGLALACGLAANTLWGLQHARRLPVGEDLRPLGRRMWKGLLLGLVLLPVLGLPGLFLIHSMNAREAVDAGGVARSRDGIPGLRLAVTECKAGPDGALEASFTLCPIDGSGNPHRAWRRMVVTNVDLDQEGLLPESLTRPNPLSLASSASVDRGPAVEYPFSARGRMIPGKDWLVVLGVVVRFTMEDGKIQRRSVHLKQFPIERIP